MRVGQDRPNGSDRINRPDNHENTKERKHEKEQTSNCSCLFFVFSFFRVFVIVFFRKRPLIPEDHIKRQTEAIHLPAGAEDVELADQAELQRFGNFVASAQGHRQLIEAVDVG